MTDLVLVGLSHKTSPVSVREPLAALGASEAMRRLADHDFSESVVLSTCNRFEVYAAAEDLPAESAMDRLVALLGEWSGCRIEEAAYRRRRGEAVRHLFSVASGLDSLIVGEAEILGQVKQAYEAARGLGRTGKLTNVLFQRALHVGKLVRTRTEISAGQTSAASVAVALAERIFGSLKGGSVLILGAGQMAELTAGHLRSGKVAKLYVANRTRERALDLAQRFQAEAVDWTDFPKLLDRVDIVIASTGSSKPILTREMLGAVFSRRGRSLFLIDIAMPRDVEESVQELEHVYLYTLSDLQAIVQENIGRRQGMVAAARSLVEDKAAEFDSRPAGPPLGAGAGPRHSCKTGAALGRSASTGPSAPAAPCGA